MVCIRACCNGRALFRRKLAVKQSHFSRVFDVSPYVLCRVDNETKYTFRDYETLLEKTQYSRPR